MNVHIPLGRPVICEPKITVVIPYFQREAGILGKAVQSVMAQVGVSDVDVLVVDDGSPIPAEQELAGLVPPAGKTVRIIRQRNAGPAAARNLALDNVCGRTRYVAFLDSDDVWRPDHLQRALDALEAGYDFYFADHFQLGQEVGAFARANHLNLAVHELLDNAQDIYAYRGNMFDQILTHNLIGTSTVVYRFQPNSTLRFREEFFNAGEDYLFWMDFARRSDKFVFSNQTECTYGAGVNIYAGSGWGTRAYFARLHNETRYRMTVLKVFPLSRSQRDFVRGTIRTLRRAAASDLLHHITHWQAVDVRLLWRHLRIDPAFVVLFVPIVCRQALNRLLHGPVVGE